MNSLNDIRRAVTAGIAGAAAVVALAAPAAASPVLHDAAADHASIDVTGAVFTCGSTEVTVTHGTVEQVTHYGQDAKGETHLTIILSAHDVTADNTQGAQFTITGASHVTAKLTGASLDLVTDTSDFVLHGTDGVFGAVRLVDHYNVNGRSFTLTFGTCTPPGA
jgi:hypothetical protein